jgi:hypothetical protein
MAFNNRHHASENPTESLSGILRVPSCSQYENVSAELGGALNELQKRSFPVTPPVASVRGSLTNDAHKQFSRVYARLIGTSNFPAVHPAGVYEKILSIFLIGIRSALPDNS